MRRLMPGWGEQLVGALILGGLVHVAGAPAAKASQQDPEDQDDSAEVDDLAGATSQPGGPDDDTSDREPLKMVLRLQKLMRAQLKLEPDQAKRIDELFKEHIERLRQSPEQQPRELSDEDRARITELQQQVAAASRDGDREAIRRLLAELREIRGDEGGAGGPHGPLRTAILQELNEEQAKKFRTLFRRVMTPQDRFSAMMREMQVFRRALRNLDLTTEQQEATRKHLAKLRDLQMQERTAAAGGAEELIAQVRQAILAELTETQAARFLEVEAEIRKGSSVDADEDRQPSPSDLPRRPIHTEDQPEAPAQGPPTSGEGSVTTAPATDQTGPKK